MGLIFGGLDRQVSQPYSLLKGIALQMRGSAVPDIRRKRLP
jgi:hypothetical protein